MEALGKPGVRTPDWIPPISNKVLYDAILALTEKVDYIYNCINDLKELHAHPLIAYRPIDVPHPEAGIVRPLTATAARMLEDQMP